MDGKNFSQRGYISLINRNHGIPVRIARYHNIFGPEGTWKGGREKPQQQSVEKWRTQILMTPSKSGEMVIKQDPSSTSTSVLRQPDGSWTPSSSAPSTSDQKRW